MFDLVLMLQNNSISSINATGPGGLIQASMSELTAFTSNLSPNASRNITYLLSLNNLTNISTESAGGSILYWTSQSRGIFIASNNNTFSEVNSNQGFGGLFSVQYTLTSSTIPSLSPEYLVTINSTFDSYSRIKVQKGAIVYAEGTINLFNLVFEYDVFQNIEASSNGGVINIDSGIYIVSTTFFFSAASRRVLSDNFGPETAEKERVLAINVDAQTGAVALLRNNFMNISAENGGVIFEDTPARTLTITAINNSFTEVTAGSRGGLFFLNQPNLYINRNVLNMSCADLTGSFVYSVAGQINTSMLNTSNVIVNLPSECNLYSFGPTNLSMQLIQLPNNPHSVYQYEQSSPTSYPVIGNLTSYSFTEYQINFTLIYQDNNGYPTNPYEIVVDESQSKMLNLTFVTQDNLDVQNYISKNCSGSTCTASLNTIILTGNAGDLVSVSAVYQSSIYTQSQQFYIQLRACLPGEINDTDSGQCIFCQLGSYSLVTNDSKCQDCPIGATCNGGSSITVNPGYYRSMANNSFLFIVPCNDSGTQCLGGYYQTNCSDAYSGVVCSQCNFQNGFLASGKSGVCDQCYDKTKLVSFATLLVVASVLYQVVTIMVTYNENKNIHAQYLSEKRQKKEGIQQNRAFEAKNAVAEEEEKEEIEDVTKKKKQQKQQNVLKPGALIVIFTTFAQISSVLANFDVGMASSLINVSVSIGNSNDLAVFSLQCLYMLVTSDLFEGLMFEILVYVLSPIVKIGLVASFELLLSLTRMIKNRHHHYPRRNERNEGGEEERTRNEHQTHNEQTTTITTTKALASSSSAASSSTRRNASLIRIGAVAVVLFLLEQPGIVSELCQYLTCTQLDPYAPNYYIKSRNNIQCYTPQYNSFLAKVIIPAFIFWAFVVPLAIFFILYFKRKQLFESETLRIVLGNFYNPYSKQTYYWGIVIIIFKMSIFVLDAILTSSSTGKGIILMLVIHVYFMLFKRIPPYSHDILNKAEKYCSWAYMMVLTMVLIKMSFESVILGKFCEVMILVFMVGAGGYVLVNVFWLYIMKAMNILEKIKELNKNKKILKETLELLEEYHINEKNLKEKDYIDKDRNKRETGLLRRNAISVEIPTRLRHSNTSDIQGGHIPMPQRSKKKSKTLKAISQI